MQSPGTARREDSIAVPSRSTTWTSCGHADRVIVLAGGRIVAEGSPDAIRADPYVAGDLPGTESLAKPVRRIARWRHRHCLRDPNGNLPQYRADTGQVALERRLTAVTNPEM
jgi:hypothetical protein